MRAALRVLGAAFVFYRIVQIGSVCGLKFVALHLRRVSLACFRASRDLLSVSA